ncbi:ExbD/TolR family protein, partial [Paracidovorax cattleyae]|uniref:ExbD/TolR family protein n=1 Tax=Paracidovorax cattleyae TaxID=80868 RepID=UPI0018AF9268
MAFGRLERTSAPKPMSDINMTPLVDVMLVLVVIFILAAPLLANAIRLDLPRAEGTTQGAAGDSVEVAIDARGQVFVGGAPVDGAALAERLRGVAQA